MAHIFPGVIKRVSEPQFLYAITPRRRKEYKRSGTIHIPVEIRTFIEQNNPNRNNFDSTTFLELTVRIASGEPIKHMLNIQQDLLREIVDTQSKTQPQQEAK